MLIKRYTQPEFIDIYNEDIGYIFSLIKTRCTQEKYKILDEKKLFKTLLYIIFIHSDKRKLINY